MKFNEILLSALIEWRKQQTEARESVSLNAFSAFIGASRPIVSKWLNENNDPSHDSLISIAPKLAELLGPSVYDELGLSRPDENLDELKAQYDLVPQDEKDKFLDEVRKILKAHGWIREE